MIKTIVEMAFNFFGLTIIILIASFASLVRLRLKVQITQSQLDGHTTSHSTISSGSCILVFKYNSHYLWYYDWLCVCLTEIE